MRAFVVALVFACSGCTQILGLDDAVVEPPTQTVTVPPFTGEIVDAGRDAPMDAAPMDAAKPDAAKID